MKKQPAAVFKIGNRVVVSMMAANGAEGTITENLGIFGKSRKQLWRVRFGDLERDLYEENLRLKESV